MITRQVLKSRRQALGLNHKAPHSPSRTIASTNYQNSKFALRASSKNHTEEKKKVTLRVCKTQWECRCG
jgi:hypothetical protein